MMALYLYLQKRVTYSTHGGNIRIARSDGGDLWYNPGMFVCEYEYEYKEVLVYKQLFFDNN